MTFWHLTLEAVSGVNELWAVYSALKTFLHLNVTVNFDTFIILFCSTGIWFTLGPDGHLLFNLALKRLCGDYSLTVRNLFGLGCLTAHAMQWPFEFHSHPTDVANIYLFCILYHYKYFLIMRLYVYKIMPLTMCQWEIFLDAVRDMTFLFSPKYMEELLKTLPAWSLLSFVSVQVSGGNNLLLYFYIPPFKVLILF